MLLYVKDILTPFYNLQYRMDLDYLDIKYTNVIYCVEFLDTT